MNTKKIWLLAITFGAIMSFLFFILTTLNGDTNQTVNAETSTTKATEAEETESNLPEVDKLTIEKGKRAISITVNEDQSVSGFVKPGSYVDIISILPAAVGEETSSQILLSNVKVLAVGKKLKIEEEEIQEPYQMVTLEVSPAEGASLAFAKELGVVTLMLREEEDSEPSPVTNISLESLKKGKMPK